MWLKKKIHPELCFQLSANISKCKKKKKGYSLIFNEYDRKEITINSIHTAPAYHPGSQCLSPVLFLSWGDSLGVSPPNQNHRLCHHPRCLNPKFPLLCIFQTPSKKQKNKLVEFIILQQGYRKGVYIKAAHIKSRSCDIISTQLSFKQLPFLVQFDKL